MEGKPKSNKNSFIIIILLVVIIALLEYITVMTKSKPQTNVITRSIENTKNKGVAVLEDITVENYDESKKVILKVQNTSSKVFTNVTPVLIYYDENNLPIHEAWGSRISYFAPGDRRYIEYYDTLEKYSKVEVGLFDRDDAGIEYVDLRDQIDYDVEKASQPDENGEIRLTFKGENKFDKPIAVEFQIAYYLGNKLIYEDQFGTVVEANSPFDTYEYYATEFDNGKPLPDGCSYEVTLAEAVEYVEEVENIDYTEETVEEPEMVVEEQENSTEEE